MHHALILRQMVDGVLEMTNPRLEFNAHTPFCALENLYSPIFTPRNWNANAAWEYIVDIRKFALARQPRKYAQKECSRVTFL